LSQQKTILFIDDDAAYLHLVGELMQQASGGTWNVVMADNPAKALGSLKEHQVDMIVVDERMPIMSGLQFVRLARPRLPNVPIVVLTGHAEEQTWELLIREGVEVLLQKPSSSEGFQTLFLTLNQLLALEHKQGFRGVMHDVQLQDILQLECLRRNSSVLEVFSKSEWGEIFIRTGGIVHAAVGLLSGEKAFYHLLNLQDGEFRLKPYQDPPEKTISLHWEMLLMEAAQMRDESADRASNARAEDSATASVQQSHFPPVELTEQERLEHRAPQRLLAVSVEGRVLSSLGEHDFKLPEHLTSLLREAEWFRTTSGLGALESFETSTVTRETAMSFQPESVVFVTQERKAA